MHIDEILRDQDGVITRRQALAAGVTRAGIARRLSERTWVRVRPEVFRSSEHVFSDRARVRADVLWLGPDATLIGVGGAWWWRMTPDPPARTRCVVPTDRRVRTRDGVVPVRRDLAEHEQVRLDGIRVASRAVTVLDAVAELGTAAGAELMDRVLVARRVTIEELREAHSSSLGRRGSRVAGEVLALAGGGARFEAERRVHRMLRRAGVRGWVADYAVDLPGYGRALLDVAFVRERVLLEIDGWAYHRDLPEFRRDRRRQNALVLAGWTVLRVTWHDLVENPDRVLAEIRTALAVIGESAP